MLEVRGCWGVRQHVCTVIASAPSIVELELSFCPGLTSEGLWSLALGACSLSCIRIAGCNVSEVSLISLVANQVGLEDIDMSGCVQAVTDEVLITIGERLRRLRSASFNHCNLITDRGLRGICQSQMVIERLSLRACSQLTPHGVPALSNLPSLASCDLSACAPDTRTEAQTTLCAIESISVGE